jgi:hypothetical protein
LQHARMMHPCRRIRTAGNGGCGGAGHWTTGRTVRSSGTEEETLHEPSPSSSAATPTAAATEA